MNRRLGTHAFRQTDIVFHLLRLQPLPDLRSLHHIDDHCRKLRDHTQEQVYPEFARDDVELGQHIVYDWL